MKASFTQVSYPACFDETNHENFYVQAVADGAKNVDAKSLEDMPYRAQAMSLLAKLGLPEPTEIAFGADDYLLFMKDIGCVIRISTAHYKDENVDLIDAFHNRIHVNNTAPLGWVHDDNVSVYIYPGTLLEENNPLNKKRKKDGKQADKRTKSKFADQMYNDGFDTEDDYEDHNVGYYNTDQDQRSLMIDVGESKVQLETLNIDDVKKVYSNNLSNTKHAGRAYERTAVEMCSDSNWAKSVLLHRELRDLFFDALPDANDGGGLPDPQKMKKFWREAHEWTHNPKRRIVYDMIENQTTGVNIRITTGAYTAKLHRPWIGEKPTINQNSRLPLSSDPRNKLRSIGDGFKQTL